MKSRSEAPRRILHRAALVALAAGSWAACFQGTDSVPLMSSASSSSGGGGGATATATSVGSTAATSSATSSTSSAAGGSGGSGGSAPDPCATALFCDDFEAYAAGSAPGGKWKNHQDAGTLAVDTGRAHSGKNAVKFSATATTYRSAMISMSDASVFPVAGNHFFGRMMFYLESAPTMSVHWTFIDASGPVPNQAYHAIYRYGGQQPIVDANNAFVGTQLMANYETPDSYSMPPVGPSTDCYMAADKVVAPVGAWSCAEWEFDGPNNTMRFWLDKNPVDSMTMMTTGDGCVNQPKGFVWDAPTFQQLDLGWESYQTDDARIFWIDDVAISKTRVGCP